MLVRDFEVIPSDVPESELGDPWQTAEGLAMAKAQAVSAIHPEAIVVGADTVVAFDGGGWRQLAKPEHAAGAFTMLSHLSGREHIVVTGIAVVGAGFWESTSDTTRVRFRQLSDAEIAGYVATGEPMDKAGAYAIQGGAKGFVESVDGSLSNVIGLPLEKLAPILARAL